MPANKAQASLRSLHGHGPFPRKVADRPEAVSERMPYFKQHASGHSFFNELLLPRQSLC